jgi:hypothetical protein
MERARNSKSGGSGVGGGGGGGGGSGSGGGGGGKSARALGSSEQLRTQVETSQSATLSHLREAVAQTAEAEEQGQEGLECVFPARPFLWLRARARAHAHARAPLPHPLQFAPRRAPR